MPGSRPSAAAVSSAPANDSGVQFARLFSGLRALRASMSLCRRTVRASRATRSASMCLGRARAISGCSRVLSCAIVGEAERADRVDVVGALLVVAVGRGRAGELVALRGLARLEVGQDHPRPGVVVGQPVQPRPPPDTGLIVGPETGSLTDTGAFLEQPPSEGVRTNRRDHRVDLGLLVGQDRDRAPLAGFVALSLGCLRQPVLGVDNNYLRAAAQQRVMRGMPKVIGLL